jgi:dipeptidyl aminopeptidase/acylaminoacyl peptidase
MKLHAATLVTLALFVDTASAQQGYQKPPQAIQDVLDAPPTPQVTVSPARDRLLLVQGERYPRIADLAAPMLGLAGARINPRTNGPHLAPRVVSIAIKTLADGKEARVPLPPNPRVGQIHWSPDGREIAFLHTAEDAIELWLVDASTAQSRKVPNLRINAAFGEPVQWLPDSKTLLCQAIYANRPPPPARPRVPAGPIVQESYGKNAPVRTFQDLLDGPHDEALFDYYGTSQLTLVDAASGQQTKLGKPALFASTEPSPDGQYLLVARVQRPYSYLLTAQSFPREVEIWDRQGQVIHKLASLPLADQVPIEGVRTGPRNYVWRPTEPATLVWAEALDGGDPKRKVPHRDRIMTLKAPFDSTPAEVLKTEQRFMGVSWLEKNGQALVRDFDRDRRWIRTFLVNFDQINPSPRVIWDRSMQDRYGDPGRPVPKRLPNGQSVVRVFNNCLYLEGDGASPTGNRPFLDRMDLTTLKTERLFQSAAGCYEQLTALLADDASRFITRHESPSEPPNYFVRSPKDGQRTALTSFPDPAPQLRKIKKQLVTYKRADGVQLSFTLYLPPDYKEGQRLPTVMWAYPREYNDPATAGQVVGSPNRFTSIAGISHLFFLLQGYAVLDDATMPVVGDPETVNNTFLEQIVASAKAAIDKAAEMGVTDPQRVGVGGHSYGAFMTANLLAHSDLFRAGIARSGAYNRTLTPFGFQSERRTVWEAPEMYVKVSPFMSAHKIKEPILLIHGQNDNNAGTFPIQSERLYHAIRGNGGNVRFVSLPHESHGYAARESVEHTLHEMIAWFDKHVKNQHE